MIKGEKWVMGGKELQHLFFFRKKTLGLSIAKMSLLHKYYLNTMHHYAGKQF
jgi:hypothetical protein